MCLLPTLGLPGVGLRGSDCRLPTHGEHGTIKSAWNLAVTGGKLDEDCALLSVLPLVSLNRQEPPPCSSRAEPQHCLSWAGSRPKPYLG